MLDGGGPEFGFNGVALQGLAAPVHAEQGQGEKEDEVRAQGPGQQGAQAGVGRGGEINARGGCGLRGAGCGGGGVGLEHGRGAGLI